MGMIEKLLAERTKRTQQLIPMTVRVPPSMGNYIEEFSRDFEISRQDALLNLLEEGIRCTQDAIEKMEFPSHETEPAGAVTYHVLNTNKKHSDEDQELMLARGVAAAFLDRKAEIDYIHEGDWVFLYQNARGIIAYGRAFGEKQIEDHRDGTVGGCYLQPLKDFVILDDALPAREIQKNLGYNHIFVRTRASMSGGEKVLHVLQEQGTTNVKAHGRFHEA